MYEETPYLQPPPGTDGSRPAWPTTPEAHMRAPGGRGKKEMLQPYMWRRRTVTRVRVGHTFGEGSFRIIGSRVRGGGPPIGESGMKEDQ